MATYKHKNDEHFDGVVPGVGQFVDGILKNAPDNLENPDFIKVEETTATPAATAPSAPANPAPAPQAQVSQPAKTEEAK